MQFCHAEDEKKPQPCAAIAVGIARLDLYKGLEEVLEVIGRNADPGIPYGEIDAIGFGIACYFNPHSAAAGGEFDGIA